MLNSRTVHAVALGSITARTASWFTEPNLADAQFDTLNTFDEISDLTLMRFDLEVPLVATEAQITDLIGEATYNLNFRKSADCPVH
jgi:hypothetical protein